VKAIRIELLIATLALLASAAASIATVVQTSVVGRQLSASVWPYLTIETTIFPNKEGSIAVINEGLGPAIIQDASVTVSGKRYGSWNAAIRAVFASVLPRIPPHYSGSQYTFGYGSVVRAGESARIIDVRSSVLFTKPWPDSAKPILSICYCSILQQCWIIDEASTGQPRSVRDCDKDASVIQTN
jgi:hypothetical protein